MKNICVQCHARFTHVCIYYDHYVNSPRSPQMWFIIFDYHYQYLLQCMIIIRSTSMIYLSLRVVSGVAYMNSQFNVHLVVSIEFTCISMDNAEMYQLRILIGSGIIHGVKIQRMPSLLSLWHACITIYLNDMRCERIISHIEMCLA